MTTPNVGSTQIVIHIHTCTLNGSPIIFSNSTGLGGKLGYIICMLTLEIIHSSSIDLEC